MHTETDTYVPCDHALQMFSSGKYLSNFSSFMFTFLKVNKSFHGTRL